MSGPLLDRLDIQIEVPAVPGPDLLDGAVGTGSAEVRGRVEAARLRQLERFADRSDLFANAHMGARDVSRFCRVDDTALSLLRSALTRFGLSARSYHRVLKIARTIADLAGADRIGSDQVAEAVAYRGLERAPTGRAPSR